MNPEQDPFASVRLKSRSSAQEQPQQSQQYSFRNEEQPTEEDPFASVRVKKSDDFDGLYETGRHAARIGSRIAETVGGIPGDLSSLIQSGVFSGLEALTGHKPSKEAHEKLKEGRSPTSKELKEFSESATGGFTKAQNEWEEKGDELAETVASLLGPMKFRKALGVGIASNLAKEGVKISGLGEGAQEGAKLGTMLLASLYNPRGALKYSDLQYDKANKLSKGASVATSLDKNLGNLISKLEKGVTTKEKNTVIKPARELLEKIKNGKIKVDELTSAKRDVNKIMGDPETLKGSKKLLLGLGKEIDNAIKPYEKINPEFAKVYRPANEIHGAVAEGQKASNFIKRALGNKSFMGALVGEALLQPEYLIPTAGAAGTAFGAAKIADFFSRLKKSPELRKYYGRAIAAATKEDSLSLRTYEDKIQDFMNKDR
jgi:hypothetical protein